MTNEIKETKEKIGDNYKPILYTFNEFILTITIIILSFIASYLAVKLNLVIFFIILILVLFAAVGVLLFPFCRKEDNFYK